MGFGGGPWFVIKKDTEKNIIYLSHGYDPESAYSQDFSIHDFHFLTINPWNEGETIPVRFKIRHTADYHRATLEPQGNGTYMVHSEVPIHGVAPGQFCVVYDEDAHRCIGSGEIFI